MMTWPHQVQSGRGCLLEHDIFFKFVGPWRPGPGIVIGESTFIGAACEFNIQARLSTGRDCLIASGCRSIDHDHGMNTGQPMNRQPSIEAPITLGDDVWLGANVIVLKGVSLGARRSWPREPW